jgi:hypothetical protein
VASVSLAWLPALGLAPPKRAPRELQRIVSALDAPLALDPRRTVRLPLKYIRMV